MKKYVTQISQSFIAVLILFSIGISCKKDKLDSVKDLDGNLYHTITIGTQVWMVENLKTTQLNDGTAITNDDSGQSPNPAYCWMKNDPDNYKNAYGALYNWHAVNTGKLAPKGWRVATKKDWEDLVAYLGGVDQAAVKLKEIGTEHWKPNNIGATNSSGFTAMPGGYLAANGAFNEMTNLGNEIISMGYHWASTEYDANQGYAMVLGSNNQISTTYFNFKNTGLSVRCIKGNP